MFDGLFGPWHLLIIFLALLIFVGPQRLAARMKDTSDTVQHWADPDHPGPGQRPEDLEPPAKRSRLYRLGRLFRRRRRAKGTSKTT